MISILQRVSVDGVTMLRKGNMLYADLDEYILAMDREIEESKAQSKVDITKRIVADNEPDLKIAITDMDDLIARINGGKNIYGIFM